MEKKSRLPQSSAKGTAGDAKKNQDVVNSKLFPKSSRRREPASSNSSAKYEQSRKSNAQKGKNFDKRPKPKGQYHGGSKEDTKVVDDEVAELGSVMIQGSKKQNLNHLLNFHYAPRDIQGGSGTWGQGKATTKYNRNSNRWLPSVQRHKYNKEQFLQANCQFVVRATGDYTAYLADPDTLVDWNSIEQIRVHSSESLSCPICLSVPIAGKMTRCGHVYCWPCILHYLALSDKAWRKCPICYEAIHKTDLKSVVEVTQSALNVGDKMSLRLMRRERGSLLAVAVDQADLSIPTTFFTLSEDNCSTIYSKLLLAHNDHVMDIIECERAQLKVELAEDPHSPENCFIEQALTELITREQQLFNQVEDQPVQVSKGIKTEEVPGFGNSEQLKQEEQIKPEEDHEDGSQSFKDEPHSSEQLLTKVLKDTAIDVKGSSTSPKFFYFYQAEDGQHVYLHAMNVKMLELQYGGLDKCPPVISGKLVEKEAGSMTEELRRRLRYLCHLPLTCQFEIAEIELTPPAISNEILDYFREQLETRRKRRQRREREERKREKKITEEENKRMGKYPTPKVHIESQRHFPQWQPEPASAGINIPSPPESVAGSSIASSPSVSTFDGIASSTSEDLINWPVNVNEHGPSFAQMLRANATRNGSGSGWPSVHVSYGTAHSVEASPRVHRSSDSDAELEGYVAAPSYSQSFGDALAQALQHPEMQDSGVKTGSGNGNGKKKKKKGKATVLFATSMARAP